VLEMFVPSPAPVLRLFTFVFTLASGPDPGRVGVRGWVAVQYVGWQWAVVWRCCTHESNTRDDLQYYVIIIILALGELSHGSL